MDKEKEIEKMAADLDKAKELALGTVGSLNNGFGGWYAKCLVEKGYGDVRAAVKEFANDLQNAIVINELIRNKDERMVVVAEIEELVKGYVAMNNEELKKKIESIIRNAKRDFAYCVPEEWAVKVLADALIAAGIGDVKESENKATAAELVAQASASTAIKKIAEWKHRAEVYKRALHIAHTAGEFAYYVDKAEKELAEEREDE